ncbi:MAG TPA: hypothetical protein PLV56_08030, partial [Synergistales bacterium]|nr:hypothetical protein [Synergistales bacterium]
MCFHIAEDITNMIRSTKQAPPEKEKVMAIMRKRFIPGLIFLVIFSASPCLSLDGAYNPWPPDGSSGVSIYTDLA